MSVPRLQDTPARLNDVPMPPHRGLGEFLRDKKRDWIGQKLILTDQEVGQHVVGVVRRANGFVGVFIGDEMHPALKSQEFRKAVEDASRRITAPNIFFVSGEGPNTLNVFFTLSATADAEKIKLDLPWLAELEKEGRVRVRRSESDEKTNHIVTDKDMLALHVEKELREFFAEMARRARQNPIGSAMIDGTIHLSAYKKVFRTEAKHLDSVIYGVSKLTAAGEMSSMLSRGKPISLSNLNAVQPQGESIRIF